MTWQQTNIDYGHIMEQYILHIISIDELWELVPDRISADEYSRICGFKYPNKE